MFTQGNKSFDWTLIWFVPFELSVYLVFISINNLYSDTTTWVNTTYVATQALQEAYGIKYNDRYLSKFAYLQIWDLGQLSPLWIYVATHQLQVGL